MCNSRKKSVFLLVIDALTVYDSEGNIIMTLEDLTEDSFSIDWGDRTSYFTVSLYGIHITREMAYVREQ